MTNIRLGANLPEIFGICTKRHQRYKNSHDFRGRLLKQDKLRRNFTREAVVNRVQNDVGKGAPSDHPHSPAKFEGDGQFAQHQTVTDQLRGFAHEALRNSSSHSTSQHFQDTPDFLNSLITRNHMELNQAILFS
ncbi:hypothetical protein TNCV_615151 [Trichonephila clavipes]|nr:hypothetical protein TNCV_615151 [Trichonephila clavipes]